MKLSASYELHCALERIQAIRKLRYGVALTAPSCLGELNASHTSQLIVYGEYSDYTIFGHRLDNYYQRAWHDTIHKELQADTSDEGEYRVASKQCLEFERVSGSQLADWLWCDLYGQTCHWRKFGSFPADQAAFTYNFLVTGKIERY